ncbi:MAG: ribose-phosphate pyrophosphokinase [Alphaproteobacteria bacterium]
MLLIGNANQTLGKQIAKYLEVEPSCAKIQRFSDMEIYVEIEENVRGRDVFIFQPTCFPANDNLMELLILIDAARRGSASRITAVIPYFGYARQDRKSGPRTPISARLVADLLETAGVDRILTVDLHATQIQGFFHHPVDNLFARPVFVDYLRKAGHCASNIIVVSPDVGGVARARSFAERLECDLAIIDKRRERAGVSEVMNVIGDVAGRDCFLVDDIVDSAGTLCNAASALKQKGANKVFALATHGVLSGAAVGRIMESDIEKIYISNSILASKNIQACPKIQQICLGKLLATAVYNTHKELSISVLFD